MDSYLSTQRSTIFQHVAVLIYVFDIETREALKDLDYYRDCIEGLRKYSADAKVFLLVHKMDLVRENAEGVLARKRGQLEQESADLPVTVFGTSIYNESLYRVRDLISRLRSVTLRLYTTGMVSDSSQPDPEREHPVETPVDAGTGVQRYRGCPVRTHDVPRGCHLIRGGRGQRGRSRAGWHSLRTDL